MQFDNYALTASDFCDIQKSPNKDLCFTSNNHPWALVAKTEEDPVSDPQEVVKPLLSKHCIPLPAFYASCLLKLKSFLKNINCYLSTYKTRVADSMLFCVCSKYISKSIPLATFPTLRIELTAHRLRSNTQTWCASRYEYLSFFITDMKRLMIPAQLLYIH